MSLLNFETAWADQENTEELLKPFETDNTELYWANDNYGLATIVKAYAGYPLNKSLMGLLPHGVYLGADQQVPKAELKLPFPVVFTYPAYLDRPWQQAGRLTIPIASPFLYALALMHMEGVLERDAERKGTVFFPVHSTANVDAAAPLDEIAGQLLALPEHMQPVTVCIHWHDYEQGRHKPFAERGMRIVSAGRLNDRQFVFRLVHILSAFKYAGSNGLSSSAFYSTALGVPYFILDSPIEWTAEEGFEEPKASAEQQAEIARVKELFSVPGTGITEEMREVADRFLRADALKTPTDLLTDLLYAERVSDVRMPEMARKMSGPPPGPRLTPPG